MRRPPPLIPTPGGHPGYPLPDAAHRGAVETPGAPLPVPLAPPWLPYTTTAPPPWAHAQPVYTLPCWSTFPSPHLTAPDPVNNGPAAPCCTSTHAPCPADPVPVAPVLHAYPCPRPLSTPWRGPRTAANTSAQRGTTRRCVPTGTAAAYVPDPWTAAAPL